MCIYSIIIPPVYREILFQDFDFELFPFFVTQILPFQTFFFEKVWISNFSHHATYRWKALEEYISNIYTFMGQKGSIFHIMSLIIFAFLPKKYVNSLSDECYQKLFLNLHFSTYTNGFLIKCTFPFFVPQIFRFRSFISKKYEYLTFALVNISHHATYRFKALDE